MWDVRHKSYLVRSSAFEMYLSGSGALALSFCFPNSSVSSFNDIRYLDNYDSAQSLGDKDAQNLAFTKIVGSNKSKNECDYGVTPEPATRQLNKTRINYEANKASKTGRDKLVETQENNRNLTGSHEVRGSIPLGSTNPIKHLQQQASWTFLGLARHFSALCVIAESELRDDIDASKDFARNLVKAWHGLVAKSECSPGPMNWALHDYDLQI
jgi:hypothetical protein